MTCTRLRKERFILSFGPVRPRGNVGAIHLLYRRGLEAFEEWAIDEMVAYLIEDARSSAKLNRENRRCHAAYIANREVA